MTLFGFEKAVVYLENFALNGFEKVFPKYFEMFKKFLLSEEMFKTKITSYNNNCLRMIKNDHTHQAITSNGR